MLECEIKEKSIFLTKSYHTCVLLSPVGHLRTSRQCVVELTGVFEI